MTKKYVEGDSHSTKRVSMRRNPPVRMLRESPRPEVVTKRCLLVSLAVVVLAFFISNPELPESRLAPCLSLGVCVGILGTLVSTRKLFHLPIFILTTITWIYFCAPFLYDWLPRSDPRRILPYEHLWKLSLLSSASIGVLALGYYSFITAIRPIFPARKKLNSAALQRLSMIFCISGTAFFVIKTVAPELVAAIGRIIGIFENLTIFGVIFALLLYFRRILSPEVALVAFFSFLVQAFVIVSNTLFARLAYYLGALVVVVFVKGRRIPWLPIVVVVAISIPLFGSRMSHRFGNTLELAEPSSSVSDRIDRGIQMAIYDYSNWKWSETGNVLGETFSGRLENVSFLSHCVALHEAGKPFKHGETMVGVFTALIPRLLWPDKPVQNHGNVLSAEYGFKDDGATVSINFPWLADLYINFGYVGMVLGSFLLGAFFRWACALSAYGSGDMNLLVFCDLLWWFLSNENNVSMVVGGILQVLVIWWGVRSLWGAALVGPGRVAR